MSLHAVWRSYPVREIQYAREQSNVSWAVGDLHTEAFGYFGQGTSSLADSDSHRRSSESASLNWSWNASAEE